MDLEDRRKAWRRTLLDTPDGMLVFEDILEMTGVFEEMFANGDRPDPRTDNEYLRGKESIGHEILEAMGITGEGQYGRLAEALSGVLPTGTEKQEFAEGETND